MPYQSLEERLQCCSTCQNRTFSLQDGMRCGLTNAKPDFVDDCPHYLADEAAAEKEATRLVYPDLELASNGRRAVNLLVDSFMLFFFGTLVTFAIGLSSRLFPALIATVDALVHMNRFERILFNFSSGLIFYLLLEYFFQTTPGKVVTRTQVVNEFGNRPSFKAILYRTLLRYVPFEAFTFFGAPGTGWHDQKSGTRVVPHAGPIRWFPLGFGIVLLAGGITVLLYVSGAISNRYDFKSEVNSPRAVKISFEGLTFDCSDNWNVQPLVIEEGVSFQVICEHKGMHSQQAFVVIVIKGLIDPEEWLDESVALLKEEETFKKAYFFETVEEDFQDETAWVRRFQGEIAGIKYYGRLTAFFRGENTLLVMKQAGSLSSLVNDFEMMESTLRMEQGIVQWLPERSH